MRLCEPSCRPKYGNMKNTDFVHIVVGSLLIQVCVGGCSGSSRESASCWYTLWYIWFVLGLFVIVITVLVVLYIKHRTKERSRHRRRRRSTRTVPIHIAAPTGPPGYAEPSHKPPSYEEAMRNPPIQTFQPVQIVPGTIIPNSNEDYGYQPPPTSMRMVPNQPLPPSYAACTQGQGYGHPT